jgi:hypothetical protein
MASRKALLCGLLLVCSLCIRGIEVESDAIGEFFRKMDGNKDGVLSKKEFYYALMEDEFEALSSKHSVPSLELEFEAQDENDDRKISLEEWELIFTPRSMRSESEEASEFIKNEIGKSQVIQKTGAHTLTA